ncbi:MAG TPA: DNA methyltransferase [Stellaceae bacterium]|nr:DNA methyltransferase [Stellaceae bacterium]
MFLLGEYPSGTGRVMRASLARHPEQRPTMAHALYYGDNLHVLRDSIASESVDLIYLDPPFNSQATYNVLFRSPAGTQSQAQIEAFEDTWHWGQEAEDAFDQVLRSGNTNAADLLRAMRSFLGENDMMAYLAMMAVRLLELHRVLKPTGSLYLHCDPTASHYLKLMLDATFGKEQFVNEIVWKRTSGKSDHVQGATHWPRLHDTIFYYRKIPREGGKLLAVFSKYDDAYISSKYPYTDSEGRRFGLWDMTGPGGAAKGNPSYEVMGIIRFWRFSRERMQRLLIF